LVQLGSNFYTVCNKLLNVLHYAVLNENSKMVEMITFSDAEGGSLIQERNFRNETPVDMDEKRKFDHLFHNIWELA